MTHLPPTLDPDERIFTLFDIKRLFSKQKKKIFKKMLWGALLFVSIALLKKPQYEIQATFKEGVERESQAIELKELLIGGSFFNQSPQAASLMTSNRVLTPFVEKMGLNAQVGPSSSLVFRALGRVCSNLLLEAGGSLKDPDPFVFAHVQSRQETPLSYELKFLDSETFSLHQKGVCLGTFHLNAPVELKEARFTLIQTPQNLRLQKSYPLTIFPSLQVAIALKKNLSIQSDKKNKSIYQLTFKDPDRHRGAKILNGLMQAYQDYLKGEHDEMALQQLGYLEQRQEEIFRQMASCFDEQTTHFASHLSEGGFGSCEAEFAHAAQVYQNLLTQSIAIGVELSRLEKTESEQKPFLPADQSPFSQTLLSLHKEISELSQKRDLIELSLMGTRDVSPLDLAESMEKLQEIRSRFQKTEDLLKSSSLEVAWNETLEEHLGHQLRLLALQEKMCQEKIATGSSLQNPFEGMDGSTIQMLLGQYTRELDAAQGKICHYLEILETLKEDPLFEISALSTSLLDPLSQTLIQKASALNLKIKDAKHHFVKEENRWKEEVAFEKRVFQDHLEQLKKVEEIQAFLAEEKIKDLQRVQLDTLQSQISVLSERIKESIRERKASLLKEKELLQTKMEEFRLTSKANLPSKWKEEKWLNLQQEMGVKMIGALTELVESKTISHHLHHVESKPLDFAFPPLKRIPPRLGLSCLLGALGSGFFFSLLLLIQTILKGFPSSKEKLKAMRFPLLPPLSFHVDGVLTAEGEDLEALRQMALFFEKTPEKKVIALIGGQGPDYSFALAENLAKKECKTLIIRCDFQSKRSHQEGPGVLQTWQKTSPILPVRSEGNVHFLTAGGYTPYGLEVIQSPSFLKLIQEMKAEYDYLFLWFRSPLSSAESIGSLQIVDQAIVTVTEEPTEWLTPFIEWGYDAKKPKVVFVPLQ